MRNFRETNINLAVDKIPEGKNYLDVLDAVAGKDMNDIQDANYHKICSIIIDKKNLTQKDVEKIIELSKTLSPKLVKAAEKLKVVLTEHKKRISENVEDSLAVKVQFKDKAVYLDNDLNDCMSFKIIWYEKTEDGDRIPIDATVSLDIDPFTPGKINIRRKDIGIYEAKKLRSIKKFSEGEVKYMNDFKKSLGNYLVARQRELSNCRSKKSLIDLVSGALGNGNDNYINSVISDIERKSDTGALQYVYNILLAGYDEKVI